MVKLQVSQLDIGDFRLEVQGSAFKTPLTTHLMARSTESDVHIKFTNLALQAMFEIFESRIRFGQIKLHVQLSISTVS